MAQADTGPLIYARGDARWVKGNRLSRLVTTMGTTWAQRFWSHVPTIAGVLVRLLGRAVIGWVQGPPPRPTSCFLVLLRFPACSGINVVSCHFDNPASIKFQKTKGLLRRTKNCHLRHCADCLRAKMSDVRHCPSAAESQLQPLLHQCLSARSSIL